LDDQTKVTASRASNTLLDRLRKRAHAHPDKTALVSNGEPVSYARFLRSIDLHRHYFASHGLPMGGTVIVMIQDLARCWVAATALRSLGLHIVAVNSLEQAERLNLRDATCIVVRRREQAPESVTGRSLAGLMGIALPDIAVDMTANLPTPDGEAPPFGGSILSTSGTTGSIKKIFYDGAHEPMRNAQAAREYGLDGDTIYSNQDLALFSALGCRIPPAVWEAGGCIIFDQRPDRLDRLFSSGANAAFIVPSLFNDMLERTAQATPAQRGLRLFTAGGFLSPAVFDRVKSLLSCSPTLVYGMTEVAAAVMSARLETPDDIHWLTPGSHRVTQVVDEDGNETAPGQEGELRTRLTAMDASGYMDDAITSATKFRDGYFYPGDLAVRREDGRIRVLGRIADVIDVGGEKMALAPLEQHIQRLLGVREVCLFGQGGEELVIGIEAAVAPPAQTLRALEAEFGAFQRVRSVVLPAFPRATSGMAKVRRSELRKQLFSQC
jgi:acyl-coenzyme A synthetase/AMP-(fatty) acid ligase